MDTEEYRVWSGATTADRPDDAYAEALKLIDRRMDHTVRLMASDNVAHAPLPDLCQQLVAMREAHAWISGRIRQGVKRVDLQAVDDSDLDYERP